MRRQEVPVPPKSHGAEDPSSWRDKRVLVTGASGFIGTHLVHRLQNTGAQVYGASSGPRSASSSAIARQLGQRSLAFDVRDARAVRDAVRSTEPHVVFHLAAVGVADREIDPRTALAVNAGGTVNLLEALRETDVSRVMLTGTSHECRNRGTKRKVDPLNAYAASKVAAWAFGPVYWRAHRVPVVTVRPFQVYGPGQPDQSLIPAAMRAANAGDDFPMTPGEQVRDFVFVGDVVAGMMAAAQTASIEGESLDLGTGTGTPVQQVVRRIWQLAKADGTIRPGARPYRPGATMHLVADADRTFRLIGWRASTSIDEGLRITMRQAKRMTTPAP